MASQPALDDGAPVNPFVAHHDRISSLRQRTISTTMLVVDVGLLVILLLARSVWDWQYEFGPLGLVVFVVLCGLAVVFLVLSSAFVSLTFNFASFFGPKPMPMPAKEEPPLLTSQRKFFYYPGVLFNILAISVLVEQSGGIIRSPYTAVLLGFLLAAQQLGRFLENTVMFGSFGVVLILGMFVFEAIVGVRRIPEPPQELVFFLLTASFVLAALFTFLDKHRNWKAMNVYPFATHATIFRLKDGTWRYLIYWERFVVDPPLNFNGDSLDEAMKLFHEYSKNAGLLFCGHQYYIEWSTSKDRPDEASCRFVQVPPQFETT